MKRENIGPLQCGFCGKHLQEDTDEVITYGKIACSHCGVITATYTQGVEDPEYTGSIPTAKGPNYCNKCGTRVVTWRTTDGSILTLCEKCDNLSVFDAESIEGREVVTEPSESVLDEARRIVEGERNDQYGTPEDSFACIASYWTTYLGKASTRPLTAQDVPMMMALLKIARQQHKPKRDNLVDIIGYAGCAARVLYGEK